MSPRDASGDEEFRQFARSVRVDVDSVIATVKQQRKRRRAVAGVVLAMAGLVAGLIVVTNQPDHGAEPAAQNHWTVNTPDIKDASLAGIAAISQTDVWAVGFVFEGGAQAPFVASMSITPGRPGR